MNLHNGELFWETTEEWTCPNCAIHHENRDANASLNILKEAKRLLSA